MIKAEAILSGHVVYIVAHLGVDHMICVTGIEFIWNFVTFGHDFQVLIQDFVCLMQQKCRMGWFAATCSARCQPQHSQKASYSGKKFLSWLASIHWNAHFSWRRMLFFVIGLLHPGAIQIPWPWQKSFRNNIPLPLALSHSFHPGLHYHFPTLWS